MTNHCFRDNLQGLKPRSQLEDDWRERRGGRGHEVEMRKAARQILFCVISVCVVYTIAGAVEKSCRDGLSAHTV